MIEIVKIWNENATSFFKETKYLVVISDPTMGVVWSIFGALQN